MSSNRSAMLLPVLALTVLLPWSSLAEAGDKLNAYKKAVADQMRDPSSVRFRNLHIVHRPAPQWPVLCGEINAKNGYGGYYGFQRLFANIAEGPKGIGAIVNIGDMADRLILATADTAAACR